jgi:hypothetical protein
MSKSAGVVLALFGLAIGLYLGFNAQAHKATVRDWDRVTAGVAHMHLTTTAKPSALGRPAVSNKPISVPKLSTSAAWKQISTAFETLLNSVERLWTRVTASIGNTR